MACYEICTPRPVLLTKFRAHLGINHLPLWPVSPGGCVWRKNWNFTQKLFLPIRKKVLSNIALEPGLCDKRMCLYGELPLPTQSANVLFGIYI